VYPVSGTDRYLRAYFTDIVRRIDADELEEEVADAA